MAQQTDKTEIAPNIKSDRDSDADILSSFPTKDLDEIENIHKNKTNIDIAPRFNNDNRWEIGQICEIYSNRQQKWVKGKITNTFNDGEDDWIVVKCDGGTQLIAPNNPIIRLPNNTNNKASINREPASTKEKHDDAHDLDEKKDIFLNGYNVTELISIHPSIISAAKDLSAKTSYSVQVCLEKIKHVITENTYTESNASSLNWLSICQAMEHEMWKKLANSIKDVVITQKINIYNLNKEMVDQIINGVNSTRSRNLSKKETKYIHCLVDRARNSKPLESQIMNNNNHNNEMSYIPFIFYAFFILRA